jgi:hypothetical protein
MMCHHASSCRSLLMMRTWWCGDDDNVLSTYTFTLYTAMLFIHYYVIYLWYFCVHVSFPALSFIIINKIIVDNYVTLTGIEYKLTDKPNTHGMYYTTLCVSAPRAEDSLGFALFRFPFSGSAQFATV